tara:strand:+ start:709 stop:1686 length:978 start_codon:yes stop_codon:yes gene_type:complete
MAKAKPFKPFKLDDLEIYKDGSISQEDVDQLIPFGDYNSNLYDSPGEILKEIQKLTSLNADDINFSGIDNLPGGLNKPKSKFIEEKEKALKLLTNKYEQFTGGDEPDYRGEPDKAARQDAVDMVKVSKALQEDKGTKKDLGFFGNMIQTLKTDADARQKFLDQLGGIGEAISRPTDPGEARSLVRDVIVGSERGEGRTLAKRKAAAEEMANVALARQRTNPMQYYTTAMKELTQQAVAAGLTPGTKPFIEFIGEKLRGQGLSKNLASYSETLRNLNEQLLTAQAIPDNQEAVQTILKQIKDIQGLITTELGGTSSGSNDIPYNPQ